jgi:magnesium chelatase subunit I
VPEVVGADVRAQLAGAVKERGSGILSEWLGPEETKLEILSVLWAGRNLLLEGPVGSGKTLLAEQIASALPTVRLAGCHFNCLPDELACPQCRSGMTGDGEREVLGAKRFVRIQGSPDLFPEDLVGDVDPAAALSFGVLDPRAFRPGRLLRSHRQLLFVDEINRLSERLQNLFLELLQERAVTVGGYEARFPLDTVVIATMNPDEYVGVGRLSEALRDRFERVRLGYPAPDDEVTILRERARLHGADQPPAEVAETIVKFANELRADEELEAGVSVRATLAAYELAAAWTTLGKAQDWLDGIRAGLRVSLRGRLTLRPTHRQAAEPDVYLSDAIGRLAW